ncbi:MAG: biosynthetic-type acetolactate synthase large subunit [Oscillospiraceae bacterium]|nr:biosynthetic-type acetolactate synthase large subunit [Oscillospiraceae bacterium]
MKLSGAKIVVETLLEQGCDTLFGYPGGQVIDLFDALYLKRKQIRHILTAHEQGAAHAADGYARATGKVGVVIATSGPGATNLITGIAAAYLDSVPVVAITGNVPCSQIGRDSFQEVDIVGVSMPVTKHNFIVKDVSELADTVREAFRIAKSGRPGPVLVDIPKDVQTALCDFTPCSEPAAAEPVKAASEHRIQRAAALIDAAERPYIYFGGGIIASNASAELLAFAEKTDTPMGCSLMGLSAVPSSYPGFLGMQGMHGHFAATAAEDAADLVIALGVRFSDRATGQQERFSQNFNILHIDIDGAELNKNIRAQLAIRGDLRDALRRLTAAVQPAKHPEWRKQIAAMQADEARRTAQSHQLLTEHLSAGRQSVLTHFAVIDAVSSSAPDDAVIVTDVGQHQMWTAQRYPLKKPRTFLTSGGLGAMGYGLGAAIGAWTATGKPVFLFTGDGGFGMNLTELATAVSLHANITVIIMNNGVLGMVRQWQRMFFRKRYSGTTLNRKTDFVRVAEAFGAKGLRAADAETLQKALRKAAAQSGPFVIDCIMDPDEPVLPMRPPGGSVDDIITEIK